MITEILSNEEELRLFCKQNQIGAPDDPYQKLVLTDAGKDSKFV